MKIKFERVETHLCSLEFEQSTVINDNIPVDSLFTHIGILEVFTSPEKLH